MEKIKMDLQRNQSPHFPLMMEDWGNISYATALTKQFDLVDRVRTNLAPEALIFCSHPPVVTLGRGTREGDVFGWIGETIEVNRGGRATYHGPNQIVVYPILDLAKRGKDLHRYLRKLELALTLTLADFGIKTETRSEPSSDGHLTGAWVGSRKIASIGIGVRGWVSFHGLALNVESDPSAFQGLKPCGFDSQTMITMEEVLNEKPNRERLKSILYHHLNHILFT